MSKLIEYIRFRNSLLNFEFEKISRDLIKATDDAISNAELISNQTASSDPLISYSLYKKINFYQNIKNQLLQDTNNLNDLIEYTDKKIDELSAGFLDESQRYAFISGVESIKDKKSLIANENIDNIIQGRCGLYTNFRCPAMYFCPHEAEYTKYLVAADPLYLVDRYQYFLDAASSQFNSIYQRKLRKYCVKSDPYLFTNMDFSALPQEQFSFIFSWNTFNYIVIQDIEALLKSFFTLLRPGGVVLFSYNNCDYVSAVKKANQRIMTFVPYSKLKPVFENIGFEELKRFDFDEENVFWIELKKPGKLTGIKSRPALANTVEF